MLELLSDIHILSIISSSGPSSQSLAVSLPPCLKIAITLSSFVPTFILTLPAHYQIIAGTLSALLKFGVVCTKRTAFFMKKAVLEKRLSYRVRHLIFLALHCGDIRNAYFKAFRLISSLLKIRIKSALSEKSALFSFRLISSLCF